jgi:hypothetical protein
VANFVALTNEYVVVNLSDIETYGRQFAKAARSGHLTHVKM